MIGILVSPCAINLEDPRFGLDKPTLTRLLLISLRPRYNSSWDFRVILDDKEKTLASALMEVQPVTLRPGSAFRPLFSSRSYTESLCDYVEGSLDILGCAGWYVVVVGAARMDDKVHFGMVTFSAICGNRVQVLLLVG